MAFESSPGYKDIFPGGKDNFNDLISNIPTKALLTNLAVLNSQIYFKKPEKEILNLFLRRAPQQLEFIYKKLRDFNFTQQTNWHLFSEYYITEMMMRVIQFANSSEEDTTPENDFNIFKAYLLIVDEINSKLDSISESIAVDPDHSFNSMSWPIMAKQYQFNQFPLGVFQTLKTAVLVDELRKDTKIRERIDEFEQMLGMSIENYAKHLNEISLLSKDVNKDGYTVPQFFFFLEEAKIQFLNHLLIDLNNITSMDKFDLDYLAIKKFPLLKHKNNGFIFLNRNFFKNKIYNAFILDLYYSTDMDSIFKGFPNFKKHIGEVVSEKRIFIPIISSIYSSKHYHLHFGDDKKGEPDCYLRFGNKIFLFEFKDYLMPSRVVQSYDFNVVKSEIDLKFIQNEKGRSKGITQLLNTINYLNSKSYDFDDLVKAKVNRGKLEIYPIIVYSDFSYSMPGVNNYLVKLFLKQLPDHSFKQVFNPVMINLDFFFQYLPHLQKTKLDKLIEDYLKNLRNAKSNTRKSLSPNSWFNENKPFEFAIPFKYLKENYKPEFSTKFLEMLGIKQ
ncbi:MAG: hypothetical protein IPG12_03010 [Saprospiraceae bacterium]|nr:hypothetical protein [Saprospiraceae bacterium]